MQFGTVEGDTPIVMVAAILLCELHYAEGATLSRRLGGWQVISWALLLSLPLMTVIAMATMLAAWSGIGLGLCLVA